MMMVVLQILHRKFTAEAVKLRRLSDERLSGEDEQQRTRGLGNGHSNPRTGSILQLGGGGGFNEREGPHNHQAAGRRENDSPLSRHQAVGQQMGMVGAQRAKLNAKSRANPGIFAQDRTVKPDVVMLLKTFLLIVACGDLCMNLLTRGV